MSTPEKKEQTMTASLAARRDAHIAKAKEPFLSLPNTDENWDAMCAAAKAARAEFDAQNSRSYFREERVVAGGFIVRGYSILTTDAVTFAVYEPTEGFRAHSSTTHSDEHGRLGAVRCRMLPAEIDALPYGDERIRACDQFHRGLDALCDEAIRAAFPEIPFTQVLNGTAWATLDEANAAVARSDEDFEGFMGTLRNAGVQDARIKAMRATRAAGKR